MRKPIVLLGIPGSSLADEVAKHLNRNDLQYYILSLDAPLEGKPVTITCGTVIWEDVDLMQAGVIFLEQPVFPWPQTDLPPVGYRKSTTYKQWVVFQREATSLTISAILVAGESQCVINRPAAAHLAISPSIALDRLGREGIIVHPWRLEPAPTLQLSKAGFVLDASGRERRYSPTVPQVGEPVLVYEPFSGYVVTFIVLGGKSVGALRYHDGEAWIKKIGTESSGDLKKRNEINIKEDWPEILDTLEPVSKAADLANRTATALDLDIAAVSIRAGTSPPEVLLCEAGPDLASWNRILKGRFASALADHLISLTAS